MGKHPLTPDEAALWARVIETVRPFRAVAAVAAPAPVVEAPKPQPSPRRRPGPLGSGSTGSPSNVAAPASAGDQPKAHADKTLDGSWDKKLTRGVVQVDRSVDLHGHTLNSAYTLLDRALDAAIREGDRVVLLVTGKAPRPESERPHARGAIRAAVGDWLAGSRHARDIAAVRPAHPRHGGAGALYIVLRRTRDLPKN
ncbi:Smr/MutS family protein [Sphingomonas immobilis]|uniref:Smr/MutS family protein n=1 Tax=Sphingomonas immobilis TaxID=3063997 RepID=A0ABT8ZTR4_9SPHN|nr:Smr/MutS family protein [Sphingomonas sp. CA1-15]MDO7840957.1 Smr/MutS family protein [Sphingomonas sp. CA1-15]